MRTNEYRWGFRGDIEGLRAVAIMLVLAAHAGLSGLAGGFVGVDVFFVLSGFLITGLLLREIADTGRIGFGDFYLRRLRRLMPALVVMVGVTSLAAAIVLAPWEQLEQSSAAAAAVFWLSNVHFAVSQLDYFAAGADSNLFLHTWSLGVEEQFYLLWPALLIWVPECNQGVAHISRLKVAMMVVAIVSFASCLLLTPRHPQLAFYMMPMRAWQFAVGALIWLYSSKSALARGVPGSPDSAVAIRYWVGWLGLAVVLGAGVMFNASMSYPGWRALLPTLGAAAIVWAGFGDTSHGVSRWLAWRPLQAIGRVSYSWYLWHWPVLLLGYAITRSHSPWARAAEILVSLGLAVISYRFIESPVRRQAYWLKHRRVALLAAVAAMLVASVFSMHWHATALVRTQAPEFQRYAKAQADVPAIYSMVCDDWYRSDRVLMCTLGPKDASHTAVVMGDSIAGQWFPALARIFDRPGWRLVVLTKSSCPMVDESFFYLKIGREYTECSTWRSHALAQLAAMKPDVIVLGTASRYGFTQQQWTEGTARVLDTISGVSSRIYVMRSTPYIPFDGPNCLSGHVERPKWLSALQVCDAPVADEHEQQVFLWLQQASSRFANVRMIDLNDSICPQGRCSAELGGKVVFRDNQHLTASFAASLAPDMARLMDLQNSENPLANGTATAH